MKKSIPIVAGIILLVCLAVGVAYFLITDERVNDTKQLGIGEPCYVSNVCMDENFNEIPLNRQKGCYQGDIWEAECYGTGDDMIISCSRTACDSGECSGNICAPECESHDAEKCYNGDLWWYDSCGSKEERSESCDYGCEDGECTEQQCDEEDSYKCAGGDLYWYDSCGQQGSKKEDCQYGCSTDSCNAEPEPDCTSHSSKQCSDGNVYWYDSCNNREETFEQCDNGCASAKCLADDEECPTGQTMCSDGTCKTSCTGGVQIDWQQGLAIGIIVIIIGGGAFLVYALKKKKQ